MASTLLSRISRYFDYYAVVKSRQALLSMDDKILEQAGISRSLLLQGADQWPWQAGEVNNPNTGSVSAMPNANERAVSSVRSVPSTRDVDCTSIDAKKRDRVSSEELLDSATGKAA